MRDLELTALLGSRICHDLISPLGAIGNGVELLAMSGLPPGPELSLISESVANASARIRFFRIAFGAAPPGQAIGRGEVVEVLAAMTRGSRLSVVWQTEGEAGRPEVKLAFLGILCLESAMPWGGRIAVSAVRDRGWTLTAESTKLRSLDALWQVFDSGDSGGELAPADVQFLLAPLWARAIGRRLGRSVETGRITLEFRAA